MSDREAESGSKTGAGPTIVCISATSRPENYTSRALAVVVDELEARGADVGAIVLPGAISIAGVRSAFDDDGRPTSDGAETALRGIAESLLEFLEDFVCPKHILEEMVRQGEGSVESWTTSV